MSKYFRPWNIYQTLLLPPNVEDFVPIRAGLFGETRMRASGRFQKARWFNGQPDRRTRDLLARYGAPQNLQGPLGSMNFTPNNAPEAAYGNRLTALGR
jgi:hypothetical protein